ncbi:hypothetical protein N7466_009778 [Penicillium verhagenii]|uniref:uncharacterized protein n=1 Tax=Penicillium verhagenii TaxID=1562060 RepID=UPI002545600B|nr:uncharacterized protein N7466_009778 [Penicillium verhagenii]KAJ5921452.1 hypothetical protein N7466_009778 [Penicillium verhagenii]
MADPTSSLGSKVFKGISATLLTSWTITSLGFSALNILNANRSLIGTAASISLLTYLACRLLVLTQPNIPNDSIARLLTTAHRGSRRHALATFAFTCAWLYELLSQALIMVFMTIFGGAIAAAIYNESVEEPVGPVNRSVSDMQNTSLVEIGEFKDKVGVDPVALFKLIPPKALIYFAVLVWANFATLGLYVLRLWWRSAMLVLGSSPVGIAGGSQIGR